MKKHRFRILAAGIAAMVFFSGCSGGRSFEDIDESDAVLQHDDTAEGDEEAVLS